MESTPVSPLTLPIPREPDVSREGSRPKRRTGKKPVNPKFDRQTRFPEKLWEAVDDPDSTLLSWNEKGDGFVVEEARFVGEVFSSFPSMLQTESFTNFRRQLRVYGFQWSLESDSTFMFTHQDFLRGHPEKVQLIKTQQVLASHAKRERQKNSGARDGVTKQSPKKQRRRKKANKESSNEETAMKVIIEEISDVQEKEAPISPDVFSSTPSSSSSSSSQTSSNPSSEDNSLRTTVPESYYSPEVLRTPGSNACITPSQMVIKARDDVSPWMRGGSHLVCAPAPQTQSLVPPIHHFLQRFEEKNDHTMAQTPSTDSPMVLGAASISYTYPSAVSSWFPAPQIPLNMVPDRARYFPPTAPVVSPMELPPTAVANGYQYHTPSYPKFCSDNTYDNPGFVRYPAIQTRKDDGTLHSLVQVPLLEGIQPPPPGPQGDGPHGNLAKTEVVSEVEVMPTPQSPVPVYEKDN